MADDIVTRLAEEIDSLKADPQVLRDAIVELERLRALGDELDEALTWDQSCPYDAATTRAVIKQRRLAWQEARRG